MENVTFNMTSPSGSLIATRSDWIQMAVPVLSIFGVLGNTLNLVVLTRRRMRVGQDRLGRSANYGLVALAISDLLFCVIVTPYTLIPSRGKRSLLVMYYKLYGFAAINLFLMISTWLIVVMAIKRYIVVTYPLHAREKFTMRRVLSSIIGVYVLSFLITLPYFLHTRVVPNASPNATSPYKFEELWPRNVTENVRFYMAWIWPVIADFIPIGILIFCNVRLSRELHGATLARRTSCPGQNVKETSHRVTLTLVIIALMLLILVSPSEILKYINPYKSWGPTGHVVASVTNLMQTLNFSMNFLLYVVVNANFRQTLGMLLPVQLPRCRRQTDIEMHSYVSRTMRAGPSGTTSVVVTMEDAV